MYEKGLCRQTSLQSQKDIQSVTNSDLKFFGKGAGGTKIDITFFCCEFSTPPSYVGVLNVLKGSKNS